MVQTDVEEADPIHLPRLLRFGGERRVEEAESQSAEERSSVHYQALTWPHRIGGTRPGGQQRPYYNRVTCGSHQPQWLEEAH